MDGNSHAGWVSGERIKAPWSLGDAPPATPLPVGAVDCHHHIFDRRFQKDTEPRVPSATVQDYTVFKRRLGLSRSVIVAPSNYGTDNACLLDALDQFGPQVARGVALVDPDVAEPDLDRMHQKGVRGLRVYLAKNRIPTPDELLRMGDRAADRGWSLQFVGNREREVLVEWMETIFKLRCEFVVDHFGWAPQPAGVESATAGFLRRVLTEERGYVKLSGLYLSSRLGFPDYRDVDALAVNLIETNSRRIVWGTDWPHPVAGEQKPDGAMLVDRLAQWAPDEAVRRMILIEAPDRLYWSS